MNKNNLFTLGLVMLMVLGLVACHKPIYSEQPVYGSLKFTTEPVEKITLDNQATLKTSSLCNAGDSITVFMQVAYSGTYITEADYTWKLYINNDSVITHTERVIAPHKKNTPPMWRFKAPDINKKGGYAVSFKASYDYSAQNEVGQIYGESSSYNTTLNVR